MSSDLSPVIFGEVLFDCFPDGSRVLGGAPFNVAWHCHAFGLNPLFVSSVGDDDFGNEILNAMTTWGMDTEGVQIDSGHKTGVVAVTFNNGEPSYNIVENSAWDFIETKNIPEIDNYSLLYHGSLVLRNAVSKNTLAGLKNNLSKPVFIDVNLRSPWWDLQAIKPILTDAHWVKLNQDELSLIVSQEKDVVKQARYLMHHYGHKLVVVTQGEAGAIAITESETCSVEPGRAMKVVDTVGAGDAFTSVLLLGLQKKWPLQDMLDRAQAFASAVVGQRGATTQDKLFYQPFINSWSL